MIKCKSKVVVVVVAIDYNADQPDWSSFLRQV